MGGRAFAKLHKACLRRMVGFGLADHFLLEQVVDPCFAVLKGRLRDVTVKSPSLVDYLAIVRGRL